MARNIFNQPSRSGATTPTAAPTPAVKLGGSVGGLRDSLREITANSIRDLEIDAIDTDGLRDRLAVEDDSIQTLADSIRAHGQQVPILVRPSGEPDRYKVVYGRRRLAAIRRIGGTVKAIVRTMDDDASLMAQGQENNLRLDPSFIEKALFIKEMQEAGYKPAVIQDALGLTRQGVSNHRVVLDALPLALIRVIGPAHGVGRRQWGELAELAAKVPGLEIATATIAALPADTAGAERFQAVRNALHRAGLVPAAKPEARKARIAGPAGQTVGMMVVDDQAITLKIARKDNPDFGLWLEDHAEAALQDLFKRWQAGE